MFTKKSLKAYVSVILFSVVGRTQLTAWHVDNTSRLTPINYSQAELPLHEDLV